MVLLFPDFIGGNDPNLLDSFATGTGISSGRIKYDGHQAYIMSKLYDIYITRHLAHEVLKPEDGVTIFTVSPGWIPTTSLSREFHPILRTLAYYILPLFPSAVTLEKGCQSLVQTCLKDFGEKANGNYIRLGEYEEIIPSVKDLDKVISIFFSFFNRVGIFS